MKPFPSRALRFWNDGRYAPHVVALSSSPSGNTNTIQQSGPWAGQQPFLTGAGHSATATDPASADYVQGIYPTAQNLFNTGGPQYYPGEQYSGLTPQQNSVMSQIIGYGTGGGSSALQAANSGITGTQSPDYTAQTASGAGSAQSTLSGLMGGTGGGVSTLLSQANGNIPTTANYNAAGGSLSKYFDPGFTDPYSNPGFNSTVQNTLASVMPSIQSGFNSAGRADSGLASRAASMGATDAVGQLALGQYNTNVGQQLSAAQQAQQDQQARASLQQGAATNLAGTELGAAGTAANNFLTQQGNQIKGAAVAPLIDQTTLGDQNAALQTAGMTQSNLQNYINEGVQKYNYGQMLPWNNLGLYENAIMGTGSPGGTSTTTQPFFSNPTANILGGVSGAAALGSLASAGAQAAGYSGLLSGGNSAIGALMAMFAA